MSEINPWPLFGYAPGGYLIQCIKCNTNHHTGDKRAIICGDCASVEAKSRIAALEKENAELRKALATIRDYPPAGGRRTADGYPMEVVYDEYAYRRIVDTYRLAARLASTERTPE